MKKIIILFLALVCLVSCNVGVNEFRGNNIYRKPLTVYKIERAGFDDQHAYYYIHGNTSDTHIVLRDTLNRYEVGDKLDFIKIK